MELGLHVVNLMARNLNSCGHKSFNSSFCSSTVLFGLLLASAATLIVAVEVSLSGYLLVYVDFGMKNRWVALLLVSIDSIANHVFLLT